MAVDIERVNNTLGKFAFHLENHNHIAPDYKTI